MRNRQMAVQAEQAGPEQRPQLWAHLITLAPGYGQYAQNTRREIPMIILHPAEKPAP
jgi:F420H(2)-dependent quinone reductase